jgi:hypothetical protein
VKAGRRDETADEGPPDFVCPGSLLRMQFDPKHPVAYGMPEESAGMFVGSPAFRIHPTSEEMSPVVVARYPAGSLLMSGYLRGEKVLQNQAAAVVASLGQGKVILLGFGVESRGQPHGTFAVFAPVSSL